MAHGLGNFASGPLDRYRKSTSFDWKQLAICMYTEEGLIYRNRLLDEIEKTPVLLERDLQTPVLDQIRSRCARQMFAMKRVSDVMVTDDDVMKEILKSEMFQTVSVDAGKFALGFEMFVNALKGLGTARHHDLIRQSLRGDIIGCFCLTEIAHGSNAKGMRTTATYDPARKEFILHTPDFQAAKCWAGLLGQTANHANVFCQLITPDGVNRGLHAFVVKIRDLRTHLPYPGVKIGDMGEKLGLNGVDNGFIMFDQYRVPYESLLNKVADVTPEGEYWTPFDDPNRRHGAVMGTISQVRLECTLWSTTFLSNALVIAVRYAGVRKQFGPDPNGDEEIPILEYQSHQNRLLPHLAAMYALKIFNVYIRGEYANFLKLLREDIYNDELFRLGVELHAISSGCKSLSSWSSRDGVQECREACAGHGYLKAARIGEFRNDNDPTMTFEGENHVLIQQTSNILLKFWPAILKGVKINGPLGSFNFLNDSKQILREEFSPTTYEQVVHPKNILRTYQWLVCHLLKSTHEKFVSLGGQDRSDSFWAQNDSQVFFAKSLAIAYIQHLILDKMHAKACQVADPQVKAVLLKLFALHGLSGLQKHISTLYGGGYAVTPDVANLMRDAVLVLCRELKDDAVALVDVVAPPDYLLNSVLGHSDGEVYKYLENVLVSAPGAFSRPSWWREIAYWKENISSKL